MEDVTVFVFKRNISVRLVLDEQAGNLGAIGLENAALTDSFVVRPVTVIDISVGVVMLARLVSHVVLKVSDIVFTVREEDVDMTVSEFPIFKTTIDDFVLRRK